jgi:hypothetical protein
LPKTNTKRVKLQIVKAQIRFKITYLARHVSVIPVLGRLREEE